MKTFAIIYNIFSRKIFTFFKLTFFWVLLFLLFSSLNSKVSNLYQSILLFLSVFEIFYFFKIRKIFPTILAKENINKNFDSFTLPALSSFMKEVPIKFLLKEKSTRFILEKLEIQNDQIVLDRIDKDLWIKKTYEVCFATKGKFITTSDLICSFILLTEPSTKILFNKDLKEEDVLNILRWSRLQFANEEKPSISRVHFWGEGIAEGLVTGWLYETKRYIRNFSASSFKSRKIKIDTRKEYEELIQYLKDGSGVILRGDPGVGKTSLVEQLARESFTDDLPSNLIHQKILEFMTDEFVAGVGDQGELLSRFDEVIEEISHSGNVIVLIENISNILGNKTYNIDLSQAIIPYLQDNQIRIIATTTPEEFDIFVKKRTELLNWFKLIDVPEPNINLAFEMIYQKNPEIERKFKIKIPYQSIKTAIDLSKKYDPNSFLPKGAVVLLQDAASKASFNKKEFTDPSDIIELIELKTNIPISKPKETEKNILINLESEMHKFIIGQDLAVSAISQAIRRIRSGVKNSNKPISFLFLGPTGVGKTETAKTLSKLYFGGEHKIIRVDMSEFSAPDSVDRFLSSDEGSFINQIFLNPFSLILLDEFEKANEKILNLFLQVFDDGRLTGLDGKTISFADSVIIATSNAGSEFIRENIGKNEKGFTQALLNFLQENALFKPELLNRFDDVIVFTPLGPENIIKITNLIINEFVQEMALKDITILFNENVVEKIAKDGFNEEYGARPIRRFLSEKIEDPIASMIIEEKIGKGSRVQISLDSLGNFLISPL